MDKNPCGEIPIAHPPTKIDPAHRQAFTSRLRYDYMISQIAAMPLPQIPGYYTNLQASTPVGTIQDYYDGGMGSCKIMITPKGFARLDVETGDLAKYSTQALWDKLTEIEQLFEACEIIGAPGGPLFVTLDEKAAEYNRFEEELIKRLDENPPLTLDTSAGSMYDTMMQPVREEMKRIAEETKANLNGD